MIIIHYYTYLGRHKYDYLNKSKGINSKYSTKNNKYKTRLDKINYTNNENSKYLQHYHGHIWEADINGENMYDYYLLLYVSRNV